MWNVFDTDPLDIQLECLDENEDAVDLTDYSVGVNLVWGDDDDERLEFSTDDLDITVATGTIVCSVTADDIATLPLGNKTTVFLVLTPPSVNQFTTRLGKISVRHA